MAVPVAVPVIRERTPPVVRHADPPRHFFTVDLEEYFQVSAFERVIPRGAWAGIPSRIRRQTAVLLEQLDAARVHATFFVLGWVAVRHPDLIRELAAAGHEIASHGWAHERITTLSPRAFRESVRRSKDTLETLSGVEVLGYRAPSFSIVPGGEWALDVLLEEGYRYDSSLVPVRRAGYGYPGAAVDPWPCRRPEGTLMEFPPATVGWGGIRVPIGGGYFRALPLGVTRSAFRAAEARGARGTFYIHPWEIDPGQPRVAAPWRLRARHYLNLARTTDRLRRLLDAVSFGRIRDALPWWW